MLVWGLIYKSTAYCTVTVSFVVESSQAVMGHKNDNRQRTVCIQAGVAPKFA